MTPAAYSVIDLQAARHNLQRVRECAPRAKIMAVIKANAYGHGQLRIARALQDADAFAVARVTEGIFLRKNGISNRIIVMEGFTSREELKALLHYQLEPVVHSYAQLPLLEQITHDKQLTIWLKMDTGMNRLGFKAEEFNAVYLRLTQCCIIQQPIYLMTHLAAGDNKQDNRTQAQITLFNETLATLPKLLQTSMRSIANSAGILAWPASITDWLRPGIMLYGISPFTDSIGTDLGLKPVMSLYSRLIAVKTLKAGDNVGYSGTWRCEQETNLGVVAIGYGDGYPRYAKTGTPVLINQQRLPLVGRVSMDMITVDLGKDTQAKPGDAVTLWGDGLAIEEIARWADTIPYTLVCGVTQRVQQIEARN